MKVKGAFKLGSWRKHHCDREFLLKLFNPTPDPSPARGG